MGAILEMSLSLGAQPTNEIYGVRNPQCALVKMFMC
jgi:hypothetical protein